MTAAVTATAPSHVTDAESGRRVYAIGGENFWSVTTATGIIANEGLPFWAAGLAAGFAFDELPTILTASRIRPCDRSYKKCRHERDMPHIDGECACLVCEGCIRKRMRNLHDKVKNTRSDEGKRTHKVCDWWARSGEVIGYEPDIAPYVAAFLAFVAEYGIRPEDFLLTEAIVVNRTHRYAGQTDGVAQIHADRTPAAADLVARLLTASGRPTTPEQAAAEHQVVTVVIDYKTREKTIEDEAFYPDQALQLTAYRYAETVFIRDTGIEERMPATDGVVLVSLRLDGCTARLMVSDDRSFAGFVHALGLFDWCAGFGTASVSTRSFPLPKKPPAKKTATPRKTTVPRKAATPRMPSAQRPAAKTPAAAGAPVMPARSVAERFRIGPRNTDFPAGAQLTDDSIPF